MQSLFTLVSLHVETVYCKRNRNDFKCTGCKRRLKVKIRARTCTVDYNFAGGVSHDQYSGLLVLVG